MKIRPEFKWGPTCPFTLKMFQFVFILQSRSVSYFPHQSIKVEILCWAHLTADPVWGKYRAIQDSKWKEGQLFGEYLCDSVPKMFFCFKVHYRLFRRVFIVCKQVRQAEGKGTWPALWLCCMTYLPFGALYKELYLVCRADYFSK